MSNITKVLATSILGVVALVAAISTAWAHGATHGKPITVSGEVVELQCYLQDPEDAHGPDHAECAKECFAAGLPAGLKVGKKLYLLLGAEHDPIAPRVTALAGKQAKVSGTYLERGGMRAIVVDTVRAR